MSAPLLVADSGPLIALARLDLLALPSRIFREVLVTDTVWDEVTRTPRPSEQSVLTAARDAQWLQIVDDSTASTALLVEPRLDAGERSALALALARQAAVLIDERLGRAAALALGLPVVGTLGILVKAREAGLIGRVRPLVDSLIAGGYFLARPLVEHALAIVKE